MTAPTPLHSKTERRIRNILLQTIMFDTYMRDEDGDFVPIRWEESPLLDQAVDRISELHDNTKYDIYKLNWIRILSDAVKARPTSWKLDPIFEYRNASDEVLSAFMRACYGAGIFKDDWKEAAEWYKRQRLAGREKD